MTEQQDNLFNKYHYNRAKIYKLCCKDANITDIYVGSTLNHYQRKHHHKHNCNNPNRKMYNLPVYQFIRAHGGFDNWKIIILEEYDAKNKNDLLWKERQYIEALNPSLNCIRSVRTHAEKLEYQKEYNKDYNKNNKEKISEQQKEYYENNKEKLLQQNKEYYRNNKEKIYEYHKEYRENNKEKISEKNKQYYENNKEKLSEKNKEKVECEICKVFISRSSLSAHKKTKKHLQNINQ